MFETFRKLVRTKKKWFEIHLNENWSMLENMNFGKQIFLMDTNQFQDITLSKDKL